LVATLCNQLRIYTLANELIATPGRKALTLVQAMVAGAERIDDCDVLRSGATGRVLGRLSHQVNIH